jgi:hypothetical protein
MQVLALKRVCLLTVTIAACGLDIAVAQPTYEGFLCCNLRSDSGGWISDANYQEPGKKTVAVGTPVKILGYGRQRVNLDAGGQKYSIGNDYSRELELGPFAERFIVKADPKTKIASFPAKTQEAIKTMKVSKGMTKEQVLMAVGYPITSENPTLDAPAWRYWLSSFAPFTVLWDNQGRVKEIETDGQTRPLVVQD